jgi:hypothetical protein
MRQDKQDKRPSWTGNEILEFLIGGVHFLEQNIEIMLVYNLNHYLLILSKDDVVHQKYYVESVFDLYESDYLIKRMYEIEGFIKAQCFIKELDYQEYWQLRDDLVDIILET